MPKLNVTMAALHSSTCVIDSRAGEGVLIGSLCEKPLAPGLRYGLAALRSWRCVAPSYLRVARGRLRAAAQPLVARARPFAARRRYSAAMPTASARSIPLVRTVVIAFALNSAIAMALWLLVPAVGSFGAAFVHSQSIGLSITTVAMAIGHLPAVARLRGVPFLLVMLAPAAPLGYLLGREVAQLILGSQAPLWPSGTVGAASWLATVGATALWGYVFWTRQRLQQEAAAREAAQRLAAEAGLRALRAQLEPHMLFNTLANLRELIEQEPRRAQAMLDRLIAFLRGTLAAAREERHSLADEFTHLQAYLELIAMRMGPRLRWRTSLPPALAGHDIPTLLLQPLVENAVKHGLEPQVGEVSLEVSAALEGDTLVLAVTDTGRGVAPDASTQGYGLAHVRERLASAYGGAARLELLAHAPRGTRAVVRLPAGGSP
jgi:signal transduction histidine kinase